MKLIFGHVAMLKTVINHRSQVAALNQLQRRSFSNERSLITGERLTPNMELLRAKKTENSHIALMLVWLAARRAHLEDYFRFYLDNGFDVLWVQTQPLQLVAPAAKNGSQKIARDVVNFFLEEKNRHYQNMMLHAFSMGGYQWGECLVQMKQSPEKFDHIQKIMKAQVYDSCVDVEGMPSAVPGAITRNKALRLVGTMGMYAYLTLAYPFATRHFRKSSLHYRRQPINVPGIYFNSVVDQVSNPRIDRDVVETWQSLGVDMKLVTFGDSKHVQHLGKHPDRYTNELVALMNKTMRGNDATKMGKWTGEQVKADIIARQATSQVPKRQ